MRKSGNKAAPGQESSKETPVKDVLVEDPVCKTLVPKHQAIRLRLEGEEGKTYYFCSEKCCDAFTRSRKEET
jgi:YHS domain-containing protein